MVGGMVGGDGREDFLRGIVGGNGTWEGLGGGGWLGGRLANDRGDSVKMVAGTERKKGMVSGRNLESRGRKGKIHEDEKFYILQCTVFKIRDKSLIWVFLLGF